MKYEWQPIETAPRDGSRFLAWEIVGPMTEEDEDGNTIAKNKYSSGCVVAYHHPLFGLLDYPYRGSIVQNRKFTHWSFLLPAPNSGPNISQRRDWALREARRLAFDAGVDDASRITALQKLLRDL